MKFAHMADIHLGHRQYGLKQREDDMASSFRATLKLALQSDPDAILLPGDLFDSRDLRPKVLEEAENALELVPDDVPVLVSRGNHDENLTPRDVTWLNFLHRRDQIVLLETALRGEGEAATFRPYDPDKDTGHAGFYDVETDAGTVRVYGLQWRGARTDTALTQVARGIKKTNADNGDPDYTVLLGHFGIEDEVPSLGGNVTHAELREVRDVVDYLALGHIHKQYSSSDWIFNPGSPEAHNTQEAHEDWNHGYYEVTLSPASEGYDGPGRLAHSVNHHHSRRRPYFRPPAFDVTPYDTHGELFEAFRDHVTNHESNLDSVLQQEEFLKGGDQRRPLVDLRFEGTLQFDRSEFSTDELADLVEDAYDALYVQTNTSRVTSAEIEELLKGLDDDEVFIDGRLQTEALEQRVFETIANESRFSERAEDVATILSDAHRMAKTNEDPKDITELVTQRRRELFADEAENVMIDIDDDPFDDEAVEATDDAGTEASEPIGDGAGTGGGEDE
ncbi:metallophosphoesterase family protein [Halospeciosus flavus]|nr:DNA repair exonuclease [Halospeciosus flavus]